MVLFVVGGELSEEKSNYYCQHNAAENANTRSSWLEETQVEFEQLRPVDFQIRHGGQEPRAFITKNVPLRKRELNLLLQELTLNENTLSAMLFEMTRSGKIDVKMKGK